MRRRSRRLAVACLAIAGVMGWLCGCATPTTRSIRVATEKERAAAAESGFEVSPVRRASDLIAEDWLIGPHHQVDAEVMHDGRENVYWVASDFGEFEAYGDEQLRVCLREIAALAAMHETSKTVTFAERT
jgi:hypothetical protein